MSKTPTPHKFGQVNHIDIPIDAGQIEQSDKSDVEEAEVASIVCIDDYACMAYLNKKSGNDAVDRVSRLLLMGKGLEQSLFPYSIDKKPFCDLPHNQKPKATADLYRDEVDRRGKTYNIAYSISTSCTMAKAEA